MPADTPTLAAIASPRRCEILRLIWSGELAAGDIHRALPDVTFGAVSLQLRTLVPAGLLEARVEGAAASIAPAAMLGPVARARTHVARPVVAAEAAGRTRAHTARSAIAVRTGTVHQRQVHDRTHFRTSSIAPSSSRRRRRPSSLLHRERVGGVVGRRLHHRPAAGRARLHPPSQRRRSSGKCSNRGARAPRLHLRLRHGTPIPLGGSRVTLTFEPHPRGDRRRLLHEFAEAGVRDEHVQGWRYQLSLFANVVTNEVNREPPSASTRGTPHGRRPMRRPRTDACRSAATADVRFRDRFSAVEGMPNCCRTSPRHSASCRT